MAHARTLVEQGILSPEDGASILGGLSGMLSDIENGQLTVAGEDEDIHTWIERVLVERIGEPARRLHTARSRNDQTAVALRLFVREALLGTLRELAEFQRRLLQRAGEHLSTWLPGYTHTQRAQPVSLAHHLLAHFWSFAQDARRMQAAYDAAGTSPLGAGALAGTSFDIDPARAADLLGLPAVFPNSMHAVADRDYALETAFACALLMVHLSRWAEEIVLWSSREFGFIELGDAIAQGSSIMPQKKNPEAAEVLRGKSARVIGDVTALLSLVTNLPLTYNSDLQEDKEPLFDALDTSERSLEAAAVILSGSRFRTDRMEAALYGGMLTATELADHLVRRGISFRTAHEQVGQAVREAEDAGVELWELPADVLGACCPDAAEDVTEILGPERAAREHASPGGPAPERVQEQLTAARRQLDSLEEWLEGIQPTPIYRAHLDGKLSGGD
jgi:argininosuccinate lyase